VKPSELAESIADIMTQTCKRMFRDEPVTVREFDTISDRVMMLCRNERDKLIAKEQS
jgi:hypothetical protein